MVDPLMAILIFMIILIFLLIILFKIRIMLHLKALNKYKHKNKVYLLYYEIDHVNYGFKENGEKTQFFINGKIFLKYRFINSFEGTGLKINSLEINFKENSFNYLNKNTKKTVFLNSKKFKKKHTF